MDDTILGYDLGTAGVKASLYQADGQKLASASVPYQTLYPHAGWHEQRPDDWWEAVVQSTRRLWDQNENLRSSVRCLAISGHSLGAVPLDTKGSLLRNASPIWSDTRAVAQTESFFSTLSEDSWYGITGSGFPPACYPVFKVMWYKDHEPELFDRMDKIIGTKDYINYRLTGEILTDHSYASGSGIYDLNAHTYAVNLCDAAGIGKGLWPEIVASTDRIGSVLPYAADLLGLPPEVDVYCGGVDNACIALGAKGFSDGRVYGSLGSSAWIALIADRPLVSLDSRPYVFAHVIPGMYVSSLAIFAAGSSLKWLAHTTASDLVEQAKQTDASVFSLMDTLAAESRVGAGKLLFNPSLAGGTSLDESPHIRGSFIGLDLKHTRGDLIRAVLEGIGFNLRMVLDEMGRLYPLESEMLLVGGGSSSPLWRQILADIFQMSIIKTDVGQDAGVLGAAAVAAVGHGYWDDFSVIDRIHHIEQIATPNREAVSIYEKLLPVFRKAAQQQSDLGASLRSLGDL